jgi:hypothetical protein
MKIVVVLVSIFIFSTGAFAQTLEDRIKALEDTLKKQEQVIKEQRKAIEALKAEVGGSAQSPARTAGAPTAPSPAGAVAPAAVGAPATPPPAAPQAVAATPPTTEEVQKQVKELQDKVDRVVEAQTKVVPSVFNPSIGLVGETIFSHNNRPSNQTGTGRPGGYDVFQRSVELNAAASVDPFARGYVVLNASVDPVTGQSNAQVEEAAIYTTSLPYNLTLKAGRFFGEFGRLSYIHDHELPFVNRPLVLDQYIGGESVTNGAQVNYLLPIPHYVSLTMGSGTQFGDTPNDVGNFRHGDNLNFWGRASTYFDLTPDISIEPGISGLWNPDTIDRGGVFFAPDGSQFTERERRVGGLDLMLAYRPLRNNQFKSITWGTELLRSSNRYDIVNPDGSTFLNRQVDSLGLYSYLAYRFHRQWTAGFLFEWVENAQNSNARSSAYSPYITWYLSHWNQLRLQYTHTINNHEQYVPSNNGIPTTLRTNDAVYLQWAWIIGSHAHGWQER